MLEGERGRHLGLCARGWGRETLCSYRLTLGAHIFHRSDPTDRMLCTDLHRSSACKETGQISARVSRSLERYDCALNLVGFESMRTCIISFCSLLSVPVALHFLVLLIMLLPDPIESCAP